jgi:hypothetical protein
MSLLPSLRPPPRGSYVKLVPAEKKLAVELVHAFQSSGDSLNASIEQVKAKFSTMCVSTYHRFRKQLDGPGAEGNNDAPVNGPAPTQQPSTKRPGRPSIVTAEHRQAIKDKVSTRLVQFCYDVLAV